MNYQLRRQAGLTLVELMIATTLSLVLLGGVLLVFSANKTTYQMQTGLGRLQENGRYALRQITADLQMAGYGGCVSPNATTPFGLVTFYVNANSAPSYLKDFAEGEFLTAVNGTATTYGGLTSVAGTDSIEIRGPLRSSVSFVTGETSAVGTVDVIGADTGFSVGDVLMISDCAGGVIFRATGLVSPNTDGNTEIGHSAAQNTPASLGRAYAPDAVVTELATHTYFVADTGRDNATGQDILGLYRFDGTTAQELVDGVEDLQIEYGLDLISADGVIDAFTESPTAAQWPDVKTVRVMLLLNSVDAASAVEPDYTYFPVQSTAIDQSGTNDFRLRQEFSAMVSVRNSVL